MFCMETLLDRETLCWDRLLVNIGTAVASSAKRTADLGRSLGCEAARKRGHELNEASSPFQTLVLTYSADSTKTQDAFNTLAL